MPYWASDSDTFGANTFGSIDGIDIDVDYDKHTQLNIRDKKMLT